METLDLCLFYLRSVEGDDGGREPPPPTPPPHCSSVKDFRSRVRVVLNRRSAQRLNANCLEHVFSYLPLKDVVGCQGVCRKWRSVIRESYPLWRRQLFRLVVSGPDFDFRYLLRVLNRWKKYEADDGGAWDDDEEEEKEEEEEDARSAVCAKEEENDRFRLGAEASNTSDGGDATGDQKLRAARDLVLPEEATTTRDPASSAESAEVLRIVGKDPPTVGPGVAVDPANAVDDSSPAVARLDARVDAIAPELYPAEPGADAPLAYPGGDYLNVLDAGPNAGAPIAVDLVEGAAQNAEDAPVEALERPEDSDDDDDDDSASQASSGLLHHFDDLRKSNGLVDVDRGEWQLPFDSWLTLSVLKVRNYDDLLSYKAELIERLLDAATVNPRLLRQLVLMMRRMVTGVVDERGKLNEGNCRILSKEFPLGTYILNVAFNEDKRVLAFSPTYLDSEIHILDTEVLKHVSTIDFGQRQRANFESLPHCMSFHGIYLYVCVNGEIQVWNWRDGRRIRRVTPELGSHWRIYPVYNEEFLGAMDHEMLYVFDVARRSDDPTLHRVFVPCDDVAGGGGGELPAATFPWTNMHLVDRMVVAHRSLLAHPDPGVFGHAFYFWSVDAGTLMRKLSFNHGDFPTVPLLSFFDSTVKFIANRAFLLDSAYLLYSFPISLDEIQSSDPTIQPRWREWENPNDYLDGSHGRYAFVRRSRDPAVSICVKYQVWDFQRGERLVCAVSKLWSSSKLLYFNGGKFVFLEHGTSFGEDQRGSSLTIQDHLNIVPVECWRFCFRCRRIGHVAKNCDEIQMTCFLCHVNGHKAKDCPFKAECQICFRCRQKGHRIGDCPNEKVHGGPYIVVKRCWNCHGLGHVSNKCRFRSRYQPTCFKCSGLGHIAKNCPSKKYYASNGRTASCFICWRKGHVRRNCPENQRDKIIEEEEKDSRLVIDLFHQLPMCPDEDDEEDVGNNPM